MFVFFSAVLLISLESFRTALENEFVDISILLFEHIGTIAITTIFLACFLLLAHCMDGSRGNESMKPRDDHEEPNWAYFRGTNYAFVSLFVISLTYCLLFYRREDTSRKSLFVCSVCTCISLAYFFGFFGVSFASQETRRKKKKSTTPTTTTNTNSTTCKLKSTRVSSSSSHHVNSDCSSVPKTSKRNLADCSDSEILTLVKKGDCALHQLETKLGNGERAVKIRRDYFEEHSIELSGLPYKGYHYDQIHGANCEIVVGYVPIPVGIAGPILLDNELVHIPMATTEGCLVASTNRGCKAITQSGGAQSVLLRDGITRAPCVRFSTAVAAASAKQWMELKDNYSVLVKAFKSTTNFGEMTGLRVTQAGRNLYLRLSCSTGDAMGMNMVSKGCNKILETLQKQFPDMEIVTISGNMCTDKKPAAMNWIDGRGKSIVVEAIIKEEVVRTTLKTTVHHLIDVNTQKNYIGSALAGSVGGFNAHASNIVTAVFLATGQDPAQNVGSSNCITVMELASNGKDLHISVTMPSLEVGTVGGGTQLEAQSACLGVIGVKGASSRVPGTNARNLARVIGAGVLAGELSLMSALAAGHLVRSHMQYNRKTSTTCGA